MSLIAVCTCGHLRDDHYRSDGALLCVTLGCRCVDFTDGYTSYSGVDVSEPMRLHAEIQRLRGEISRLHGLPQTNSSAAAGRVVNACDAAVPSSSGQSDRQAGSPPAAEDSSTMKSALLDEIRDLQERNARQATLIDRYADGTAFQRRRAEGAEDACRMLRARAEAAEAECSLLSTLNMPNVDVDRRAELLAAWRVLGGRLSDIEDAVAVQRAVDAEMESRDASEAK